MANLAELDERIAKCEKILEADPNSQIFAALAEAFRRKGDMDKAFRICQNGLRIHPSYGSAHVVMAKINLDRGMYDWAEIEANKAVEIDGQTRSIRLLLAEVYIYKGQTDAAVKILKQLSESGPENPHIRKLLNIALKIPSAKSSSVARAAVSQEAAPGIASVFPVEKEEDPVDLLTEKEIIRRSRRINGVSGALYVNHEGLIVESDWSSLLDPNRCAASFSDVGNAVNEELMEGSFGLIREMLIETDDPIFYLVRSGNGAFLFVAEGSVNLGSLRLQMERLMANYHTKNKEVAWK